MAEFYGVSFISLRRWQRNSFLLAKISRFEFLCFAKRLKVCKRMLVIAIRSDFGDCKLNLIKQCTNKN